MMQIMKIISIVLISQMQVILVLTEPLAVTIGSNMTMRYLLC